MAHSEYNVENQKDPAFLLCARAVRAAALCSLGKEELVTEFVAHDPVPRYMYVWEIPCS